VGVLERHSSQVEDIKQVSRLSLLCGQHGGNMTCLGGLLNGEVSGLCLIALHNSCI